MMKADNYLKKVYEEINNNLEDKRIDHTRFFYHNIKSNNIFYKIFRILTNQKIRDFIYIFLKLTFVNKETNNIYKPEIWMKLFSLDYLEYINNNKNVSIPLSFFPKKDHQKILDFLRIYIYFAFFEKIPIQILGKKNYEEYKKAYKLNDQINIKNGYFEFRGFKNIKPSFEALFHNYGLDIFTRKYETCIDLGAFVGDTAYLMNLLKNPKKIYAFEPDRDNLKILKENIKLNNLEKKVVPVPLASGIKNDYFYITQAGACSIISKTKTKNQIKVRVIPLDEFVKKEKIKKVDFIKMDIEGAEFDTLKGAVKTLKRDKPDLVITIYHKGEHFFEIPKWLKKQVPEYNLRFLAFSQASPIIERAIAASTEKI